MPGAVTKNVFKSTIQAMHGGGAAIVVPKDVVTALKAGARPKIKATIDNHPYRGTLAVYGGVHYLGVLKDIRQHIGKDVGDNVTVTIERDTTERTVVVPADLEALLSRNAKARTFFEQLAFTPKKEYVRWIKSAKKSETRTRRLQEVIVKLSRADKL